MALVLWLMQLDDHDPTLYLAELPKPTVEQQAPSIIVDVSRPRDGVGGRGGKRVTDCAVGLSHQQHPQADDGVAVVQRRHPAIGTDLR